MMLLVMMKRRRHAADIYGYSLNLKKQDEHYQLMSLSFHCSQRVTIINSHCILNRIPQRIYRLFPLVMYIEKVKPKVVNSEQLCPPFLTQSERPMEEEEQQENRPSRLQQSSSDWSHSIHTFRTLRSSERERVSEQERGSLAKSSYNCPHHFIGTLLHALHVKFKVQ